MLQEFLTKHADEIKSLDGVAGQARRFSDNVKIDAVALASLGVETEKVTDSLSISTNTYKKWCSTFKKEGRSKATRVKTKAKKQATAQEDSSPTSVPASLDYRVSFDNGMTVTLRSFDEVKELVNSTLN